MVLVHSTTTRDFIVHNHMTWFKGHDCTLSDDFTSDALSVQCFCWLSMWWWTGMNTTLFICCSPHCPPLLLVSLPQTPPSLWRMWRRWWGRWETGKGWGCGLVSQIPSDRKSSSCQPLRERRVVHLEGTGWTLSQVSPGKFWVMPFTSVKRRQQQQWWNNTCQKVCAFLDYLIIGLAFIL